MKKKLLVITVLTISLIAAVSGLCQDASSPTLLEDMPTEKIIQEDNGGGIEPAIITCDSGAYGRCQKADCQRDGIFYTYFCRFTGKQTDYCPVSMYSL